MDCNTCDTAPTILVNAPEVIQVSLTITEKAKEMLQGAFGDDRSHGLLVGVLSGGCSGYMYDLQIVESTEQDCQELNIDGFKVLVPNASSHLLDGIEIDYVDRMMGGGFGGMILVLVDNEAVLPNYLPVVSSRAPLLEEL